MQERPPHEATSHSIYTTLKNELLSLVIKPGEELSENSVCRRFGVSRTPVRTAFQRLRDEGLIDVVPYKGTRATLLDFEQIDQLIYMRVAVEIKVLQDAMRTIDHMTIEQLRHALRYQASLLENGCDAEEFYAADAKMHRIWFRYTKKDLLWKAIQRAQTHYTRFRMLDIVTARSFDGIYQEHLELFDLIQNRNIAGVEPLIYRHLYGAVRRLEGRIQTEFADYFLSEEPEI